MRITTKALALMGGHALLAALVLGAPASRMPVAALSSMADTVVIGTFDATIVDGGGTRTVDATIRTEKVLKGTIREGAVITARWSISPTASPTGRISNARGHGMMFLRGDSSPFSLISATAGFVSSVEDTYLHTPPEVPEPSEKAQIMDLMSRIPRMMLAETFPWSRLWIVS